MTKTELLRVLQAACDEIGGQAELSRQLGVTKSAVNHVLRGRVEPPDKILAYLGYRREITYHKKEEDDGKTN